MAPGRTTQAQQEGEEMMFMAFHSSPQRRPYLIAVFGILLMAGVLVLTLT